MEKTIYRKLPGCGLGLARVGEVVKLRNRVREIGLGKRGFPVVWVRMVMEMIGIR